MAESDVTSAGQAQRSGAGPADDAPDTVWPYLAVLLRWRRFLIAVPLLLAVLVVGITVALGRRYSATTAFVPQETSRSNASLAGLAAQFGVPQLAALAGGAGGSAASPQFYAGLLQSREVLHSVVTARYTLKDRHQFSGTLVDYYDESGKTRTERELRAMKRLNEKLIDVGVDRQSGVVNLAVTTTDPELSVQVVRRFLDLVVDFNQRRRQTTASAERDFTEHQAQQALSELRAAEAAMAEFRMRNRSLVQPPQLAIVEAGLQRRVTIAQQVYSTLVQQFELSKVEAVRNTPVVTVIDSPEGLVEPQPRLLALKAALSLVLGFLLAVAIALTTDSIRRSRDPSSPAYADYLATRSPSGEVTRRPKAPAA